MNAWPSASLTANGIKIHYYRTGGDTPPVVLSHGFSDNGMCWIRVAQALVDEYDLIMPDARGHGLSDAPDEGYEDADRSADLAGLIQGLDLDRPALIGHSMGAATTAMTAARYPELVGRIVLEDPPWFDPQSPWAERRMDLSQEEQEAQVRQFVARTVAQKTQPLDEIIATGRQERPMWDKAEWEPWAKAKQQLSPKVIQARGRPRTEWSELVPDIRCPTLLVTGSPDKGAIVTPRIAAQVAEANPLIEVVHLEGAGHNIRRERFEGFVKAVRAFLSAD
jgi:pimeloyl-ACP methyl ester carboxylesterase